MVQIDMMTEENFNADVLRSLGERVQPSFREEFLTLIQTKSFGTYQEFLIKSLSENQDDYTAMFDYGIAHLLSLAHRPDYKLATYYLALSLLKDISDEFHDLATDSMIFCENEGDAIAESEALELHNRYENKPLADKEKSARDLM